MNQFALLNFALEKNERILRVVIQPGTPWKDLHEAMDEFKNHFIELEAAAEKQEVERREKEAETLEVSA